MMPSGNVVSVVRASPPIMQLGGHLICVLPCTLGFQFRLGLSLVIVFVIATI